MKLWRLDPERAAEWRHIRLEALRLAPESFSTLLHEWQDRPLADFAGRLAMGRVFAAGHMIGNPMATAGWHEDLTGSACITGVYCRPEGRGQGFAAAVIGQVEQDARAHGMTRSHLRVFKDNPQACSLYERAGYRVLPPQAGDDPRQFVMEKPLQAYVAARLPSPLEQGAGSG